MGGAFLIIVSRIVLAVYAPFRDDQLERAIGGGIAGELIQLPKVFEIFVRVRVVFVPGVKIEAEVVFMGVVDKVSNPVGIKISYSGTTKRKPIDVSSSTGPLGGVAIQIKIIFLAVKAPIAEQVRFVPDFVIDIFYIEPLNPGNVLDSSLDDLLPFVPIAGRIGDITCAYLRRHIGERDKWSRTSGHDVIDGLVKLGPIIGEPALSMAVDSNVVVIEMIEADEVGIESGQLLVNVGKAIVRRFTALGKIAPGSLVA